MNHSMSEELLNKQKDFISKVPHQYSMWEHYKGGKYIVTGAAMLEHDESCLVLYASLDSTTHLPWARPLTEWFQTVEIENASIPRFKMIGQLNAKEAAETLQRIASL